MEARRAESSLSLSKLRTSLFLFLLLFVEVPLVGSARWSVLEARRAKVDSTSPMASALFFIILLLFWLALSLLLFFVLVNVVS